MSQNPVDQRLASQTPDGIIVPSGVATFRRRLADPASAEPYFNWSNQTETKLVRDALRDLALHGPVGMANPPTDTLIQYGMSLGLQLAEQLISDPSLVFPEAFRGRAPQQAPEVPAATFDTRPEDIN